MVLNLISLVIQYSRLRIYINLAKLHLIILEDMCRIRLT
uniref:Uncharacterized protein n=1 Tax=Podoviridae sp. ctZkC8 TaxID=2825259 RepID=A0A8S5UC26_9CAUD|nr:MAG TPA: hypothetical protein [Podoviridae sp. ctZkC8]